MLYSSSRIGSNWNLEFPETGKKQNTLESLVEFYRLLHIRIPMSFFTRKNFQWSVYRSILEQIAGIMTTIRQLNQDSWLSEQEQELFSSALHRPWDMNSVSDTGLEFYERDTDYGKVTSSEVQAEMKSVLDILDKYSNSSKDLMSFEEMRENVDRLVKMGEEENQVLDEELSNYHHQQDVSRLRDQFSRILQLVEDMAEHQEQIYALDEWKQKLPILDSDFGKKIQKMVALLGPSIETLKANQTWNQVCSQIIRDGRKLESIDRQLRLCESLLLRLERRQKDADYLLSEEHKENVGRNE